MSKVRIELFFKSIPELKERIRLLSPKYTAFNLVNKNDKDSLQEWCCQAITAADDDAHVCVHYSLKYQKVKKGQVEDHFQKLRQFVSKTPTEHEILLISGSTKSQNWDTIEALRKLKAHHVTRKMAVAYNPFFADPKERKQERDRLQAKLGTGLVSKIYFQFGTDLDRIRETLQDLSQLQVPLAASIFLPTKKLIAQQKFRPWKGVFLSEDFLSGPEQAEKIVLEMIQMYKEYDVELLIEAPGIRNEKDLQTLDDLLGQSEKTTTKSKETKVVNPYLSKSTETKVVNPYSSIPAKRQKTETTKSSSKKVGTAVVLFQTHDLRLHDNFALLDALQFQHVLPVFLWKLDSGRWGYRGAIEVVLKAALENLEVELKEVGLPLIYRNTDCLETGLLDILSDLNAAKLCYNRENTPEGLVFDRAIKQLAGCDVESFQSSLLYDINRLELTKGFHGGHWGTLMPFLKGCKKQFGQPPRSTPRSRMQALLKDVAAPDKLPLSCNLSELKLATMPPNTKWDVPILERFQINSSAAQKRLDLFMKDGLPRYESDRSRADKDLATSCLSVHLRLGTISPYELYWRIEESTLSYDMKKTFYRRLFWRDLAYFQLFCFPDMRDISIRKHYEKTAWVSGDEKEKRFKAWKRGMTGYPIVDAGMRELYATGWMNQSVRMVVASFLVEYLRLDWKLGAEWFDCTLADSDSAINPMMWQNAGRSGIDQWNFVLNPESGSQDPSGSYTKKWVPELSNLPAKYLHSPWKAPDDVILKAGVVLGETYPNRIVDNLNTERKQSVEAVLSMRRSSQDKNDPKGYDLIDLPNGEKTVVFTKQEYRIDRQGNVRPPPPPRSQRIKAPKRQSPKKSGKDIRNFFQKAQ